MTQAEHAPSIDALEHLQVALDICEKLFDHGLDENGVTALRGAVRSIHRAIHLLDGRGTPAFKFHS